MLANIIKSFGRLGNNWKRFIYSFRRIFITFSFSKMHHGSKYVDIVSSLFSLASYFVEVHDALSPCIALYSLIRKVCPLSPYLNVLTINSLRYLLGSCHSHRIIDGISLLYEFEMTNNNFVDDSWLLNQATTHLVDSDKDSLFIFSKASHAKISDQKIQYLFFSLEDPPNSIPPTWTFTLQFVILRCHSILFGMRITNFYV